MRILHVHKYFYRRGGDAVVFFDTARMMEKEGHTSAFFSMHHPKNLPTVYSSYFVSSVDFNNAGSLYQQLKAAARVLYSFEAKRKINKLIRDFKPDIAHIHNICHQLSPSVIDALYNNGIPVVMTLHDYKMTCAAYTLLSGNGRLCDECRGGRYYRALVNRCTKGSRLKSALNVAEMYLHHKLLHVYEKVDVFISPSRYLLEKIGSMGFTREIDHLPNFVDTNDYAPKYEGEQNTIVFLGRLSKEKGVETLLHAMKGLDTLRLKVIGEGPLRGALEQECLRENISNVTFYGYQTGNDLKEIIRNSAFVVVPSEWYENNPRSVLEAFALGKSVIGARIGGIPELVKDGDTGLTFTAGDEIDLREKILSLIENRQETIEMGKRAREIVERQFSRESHYRMLMGLYEKARTKHQRTIGKG